MLTKIEVNEALALLDGWVYADDPLGPKGSGQKRWQKYLGQQHLTRKRPPDYCGDWNILGPWLDSLLDDICIEVGFNAGHRKGRFRCTLTCNMTVLGTGYGDTRKEAIAHAILGMAEEDDNAD